MVCGLTLEYLLRAILALAQRPGQASTAQELAARTAVPGPYLAKLLQILVRGGLVRSRRGLRGGFTLDREPGAITLWQVLSLGEQVPSARGTSQLVPVVNMRLAGLHSRVERALDGLEQALRRTTLADILAETRGENPLCSSAAHASLSRVNGGGVPATIEPQR